VPSIKRVLREKGLDFRKEKAAAAKEKINSLDVETAFQKKAGIEKTLWRVGPIPLKEKDISGSSKKKKTNAKGGPRIFSDTIEPKSEKFEKDTKEEFFAPWNIGWKLRERRMFEESRKSAAQLIEIAVV